jgi:tetratricopeptide (TPR) repeat protein
MLPAAYSTIRASVIVMTDSTIHVGEGGTKKKGPRWQFIAVFCGVLVLALGAGAFVRWMEQRNTDPADNNTSRLAPQPDTVADAQDLLAKGKTDDAAKHVENALSNKNLSNDEKYLLYIEQGRIAQEKGDYPATAAAYEKAEAIKETYDVSRRLGATWQQIGDKQKALTYYEQALRLNPQEKDNPMREAEANSLRKLIDALKEQLQ